MADFVKCVSNALDPNLTMRLFKHQAGMALYVGLWTIWVVDESYNKAKIILCTVGDEKEQIKKLSQLQ